MIFAKDIKPGDLIKWYSSFLLVLSTRSKDISELGDDHSFEVTIESFEIRINGSTTDFRIQRTGFPRDYKIRANDPSASMTLLRPV